MKTISLHVSEDAYERFRWLAEHEGRSIAELIREAMGEYLKQARGEGPSILDLPAHDSGPLLEPWTRTDLYDQMLER